MPCARRSPREIFTGCIRDVQQLNLDLVRRAAIVGVDDADAVGDHQPALERRAAAGKYPEKVAVGHGNHQARPNQLDASGGNFHVNRCRQVEAGSPIGGGFGQANGSVQAFYLE